MTNNATNEKYHINTVTQCSQDLKYIATSTVTVRQKFGTSPVGMSWDRKPMIPTQSQLFAIPSPDQPPLLFC